MRIFIDSYYSTTNIALSVIKTATGIIINETNYNNYAATRRIVVPPVPSFFSFDYLNT